MRRPTMPRIAAVAVAAAAVAAATLLALPAAAGASPVPTAGPWSGIEYDKGKPTDFVQLRFSLSSQGRFLQQMDGTVHAECDVAGGTPYFQDFDLGYRGRERITAGGRLTARYDDVTHPRGATAHRTLTITGRFSGRRASGTLDFHSYVEHSGPGCSYHAQWRASPRR